MNKLSPRDKVHWCCGCMLASLLESGQASEAEHGNAVFSDGGTIGREVNSRIETGGLKGSKLAKSYPSGWLINI